jgi:hypothetical protein
MGVNSGFFFWGGSAAFTIAWLCLSMVLNRRPGSGSRSFVDVDGARKKAIFTEHLGKAPWSDSEQGVRADSWSCLLLPPYTHVPRALDMRQEVLHSIFEL